MKCPSILVNFLVEFFENFSFPTYSIGFCQALPTLYQVDNETNEGLAVMVPVASTGDYLYFL